MHFHGSKSSFNFYRKKSENEENHSQCQPEHDKGQNLLSENSNNADQNYVRNSSYSG